MNRTGGVEHVHLLVANLVGLEGDHRLHRHQTEQLHQVILHHVAQRSGVIVITAAVLDAHGFGDGDGHIINVATIPDRLEERIGKTKGQNVLHRFLAEIVINPKDLRFVEAGGEDGIQGARGFQVVADRLLDHDPRPFPIPRQPGLAEIFWNFAEHARRRGHVEDAMGLGAPLLFQLRALFAQSRVSWQLLEIARLVMDVLRELIPGGGLGFSETGELIDAIVQPSAQRVIAELDAVHRNDRKLCGQAAVLREVKQGRHEFPPGQVTGSAKNDEHRRFELVIRFHAAHGFTPSV